MVVLVNTNTMTPPIAPIGLDYLAGALERVGVQVDIVDLCLADDPAGILADYFATHDPELVGVSFRNVDDCFWPSAKWFAPNLTRLVASLKTMTDAPIVVGGVGFSIFPERIVEASGADFGIRGDGEDALVSLLAQLRQGQEYGLVPGLIWRNESVVHSNPPAWRGPLSLSPMRNAVDNVTYFKHGGQCGLETKRGCNRSCLYCADPLAKGHVLRVRDPMEVADEAEALLEQGVDVLHICDAEFNVPRDHAVDVCREFIRRDLGNRLCWYVYMAVLPFDNALAELMARAGCVGINFTADSASEQMLSTYRQQHLKGDLDTAVKLCRGNDIRVMLDLLLGGPGETPETAAETIDAVKQINPDVAGASLGIRIYPGTGMAKLVMADVPPEYNQNLRRRYSGAVDFFKPTFYVSTLLGERPAELICDLIGPDTRFFAPTPETSSAKGKAGAPADHNYNDSTELQKAIKNGARGAYWDILRQLRTGNGN